MGSTRFKATVRSHSSAGILLSRTVAETTHYLYILSVLFN